MTYADATETADGLESASDKQVVDKLCNPNPTTSSSLSMTPSSGSFGSASYNVTYLELPNRLIWLAALVQVPTQGSATGTITLQLPVNIANSSNGTGSINARGYDYGRGLGLDIASTSPSQLRVQSPSGSGNASQSGSYISFQCIYQGAS